MAVGSSNDFDLVVLGAGTGGYTAAFRAAQLGLKVALVDQDRIGGTCLHRGCIPTKALLESGSLIERIRHAKALGITLPGEPAVDYEAMAANKDAVVKRMWTGLKSLVTKNKVTFIEGRGPIAALACRQHCTTQVFPGQRTVCQGGRPKMRPLPRLTQFLSREGRRQ